MKVHYIDFVNFVFSVMCTEYKEMIFSMKVQNF